jgi:mono/diheme cytochrome c family protein
MKAHFSITGIIMVAILISSCYRDKNHPGYVFLPDMDESRAYETYSENPNYEDGKTMQGPVEGTIARGEIPYPLTKEKEEDVITAGKTYFNPYKNSKEVLAEGKILYDRFCITCHGELGDGKGHLYTSRKFPFPPGNLLEEKHKQRPDGEIFHVITVGFGIMGAHGPQIKQDDRWKIVAYVRELQEKTE